MTVIHVEHRSCTSCRWHLDRGVGVCVREPTATARSPAATLIAGGPHDPWRTQNPRPRFCTRFPIRGEIRLFNTADTNCYLKVASVPWGSVHSDATTLHRRKRKCGRPAVSSFTRCSYTSDTRDYRCCTGEMLYLRMRTCTDPVSRREKCNQKRKERKEKKKHRKGNDVKVQVEYALMV